MPSGNERTTPSALWRGVETDWRIEGREGEKRRLEVAYILLGPQEWARMIEFSPI
jgi:hypothetical protein